MIALYLTVALLMTATIVAVMFLTRSRPRPEVGEQADLDAAGPTTMLASDVAVPQVAQRKNEFDPGGTMIYGRQSPTAACAAPKTRQAAATDAHSAARLVGLAGSLKGSSFVVSADGIKVGRSPYSDIVLKDPRVSFRHAWIGVVDGKVLLRDLHSTNGTFLNAQAKVRITETVLQSGDTIFFGGHQGDQFRLLTN